MRLATGIIAAFCAAAAAGQAPAPRDPAKIWNREELYRTPKAREFGESFRAEATPVFIEGEKFRGKPTRIFAYYGIPSWASAESPAPAIILIHGGLGTAYPGWVSMWVRRGYAAICVDNCGALPMPGADGKWIANPDGGPRGWGRADAIGEPEKDQWVYHAVAAVMRSHSFLISKPGVDKRNVGTTGISWGGFLACIAAAADDRLAYAVPVYGCGFNHEKTAPLVGRHQNAAKWGAMWDAAAFLPFAKCPMLWLTGTNDFAFSLDRVMRSADLAKGEQSFAVRLRMRHAHGPAGEAPAEILEFADRFARGGKGPAKILKCALEGGVVKAEFEPGGVAAVRAELLYTKEGAEKKWADRRWEVKHAEEFDASGRAAAKLPKGTKRYVLNVVGTDGRVASSRYFSLGD